MLKKDNSLSVLMIASLMLFFCSCASTKKVIYLNDLTSADSTAFSGARNIFETPIQKNDQLWITVGASNPLDIATLNSSSGLLSTAGGNMGGNTSATIGYLVEADGTIKVPYVGKVKAEGLTRLELENQLTKLFQDYTKNPVVNVRFLNYAFTVMGEVNRPGRFNMATERVSIIEGLSMAGDINYLGKSDNILVIREENGQRTIGRVNLLSKEIFNSPYYYLKTNDVIYVEPVKAKFISRAGVPQYISLVAVGLSLILTVINITK